MNRYTIYYRHVNNSRCNIPGSKSFDNDMHETVIEAGKSKVAESKLMNQQKEMFNRTIRIIRVIEEK